MKNIIDSLVRFLKSLFSSEGEVGSKRVVGFGAFLLFAVMVIANTAFGTQVQEALIWADIGIIVACFGLNTMLDIKALSAKSQVASDIVKENASLSNTQKAQEVLTADKPPS